MQCADLTCRFQHVLLLALATQSHGFESKWMHTLIRCISWIMWVDLNKSICWICKCDEWSRSNISLFTNFEFIFKTKFKHFFALNVITMQKKMPLRCENCRQNYKNFWRACVMCVCVCGVCARAHLYNVSIYVILPSVFGEVLVL